MFKRKVLTRHNLFIRLFKPICINVVQREKRFSTTCGWGSRRGSRWRGSIYDNVESLRISGTLTESDTTHSKQDNKEGNNEYTTNQESAFHVFPPNSLLHLRMLGQLLYEHQTF